jgi:hypothetical protein
MKKKRFKYPATKKGLASFYVVIFTTLILTVIVLSFIRIMVSDIQRANNEDLSQSAYDSALAGIEDTKAQLLSCIKAAGGSTSAINECVSKFSQTCEEFQRTNGGSVQVGDSNANQSYTCVLVTSNLEDYRVGLNDGRRTTVVPLDPNARKITVEWYTPSNNSSNSSGLLNSNYPTLYPKSKATVPPIISAQLIVNNEDRGMAVLYPVSSGGNVVNDNGIDYSEATFINGYENGGNQTVAPQRINCDLSKDFGCNARIVRSDAVSDNTFLILNLPYGGSNTDIKIQQYFNVNDPTPTDFGGAQISIDSTGRASNYYRRVESRVELTNSSFSYPEYAVQIAGDDSNSSFSKNFSVTQNCWRVDNGFATDCSDSK